ncbi:polysaccharide deacetylase family protein [Neptuniibacter sp. QD72_48]|uniref:polysaccharide deacetylase family protein n=1 Tax=unclassified Neptuniibacter TaxID=2630693 RepID=UPI0039F59F96
MIARQKKRNLIVVAWLLTVALCIAGISLSYFYSEGLLLISVVTGICLVILALFDRGMRGSGGVPVLIYHSVSDDPSWLPWAWGTSITVKAFRQQLDVLKHKNYNVLSTSELYRIKEKGEQLPDKPVVLHFDDGYLDNFVAAAPLLKEYQIPASFYVSTGFIDPSSDIRSVSKSDEGIQWHGYMNCAELKALDSDPLFEIESHGVSHGKIVVSDRKIGVLTEHNWRFYSWLDWSKGKTTHNWYQNNALECLAIGDSIPECDSELTGKKWNNGTQELDTEYESRVKELLRDSKQQLEIILDREVTQFCWPFDRVTPQSHAIALDVGYKLTTGGKGSNLVHEPHDVVSRIHACDYGWGWRWPWGEQLLFHAKLRLFQGNLYWLFLVSPANKLRKIRHKWSPISYVGGQS